MNLFITRDRKSLSREDKVALFGWPKRLCHRSTGASMDDGDEAVGAP